MIYPTLIIDNFFENPDEIRNLGVRLEKAEDSNAYPGKRTQPLSEMHTDFFHWSTNKILAAIYNHQPDDMNITFNAYQTFQAIKPNPKEGKGWVHGDTDYEFTAIVYMSKHKNCGTSIYKRKDGTFPFSRESHMPNNKIRKEYYGGGKKYDARYFKARDENNENFEKTIEVESLYNRLLILDSFQYHGVENFYDPAMKEDRLTLITFFSNVQGTKRLPIPNVRRFI